MMSWVLPKLVGSTLLISDTITEHNIQIKIYMKQFHHQEPFLHYSRVRTVKKPERGSEESAGIDFFVPMGLGRIQINKNQSALIPSGIHVNIPKGWALIAFNKSGVATKKGLIVGACVVDSDYQGEVHIHVINTLDSEVIVEPGEKLVQFLLVPIGLPEVKEIRDKDFLYPEVSERGSGGFGSTGDGIKEISDEDSMKNALFRGRFKDE